jgi:hypothetical protein
LARPAHRLPPGEGCHILCARDRHRKAETRFPLRDLRGLGGRSEWSPVRRTRTRPTTIDESGTSTKLLLTTVYETIPVRMPAHLTQVQVRKVLNLPTETMRHWRKVLPPLARRARRAPFSHGDLVALAAIRELVRSVGLNSSALAPCSGSIFSLCNEKPWPALAQCRLEIEGQTASLTHARASYGVRRKPVVLLPLGPLIEALGKDLPRREAAQAELRFPPTALRRQRR